VKAIIGTAGHIDHGKTQLVRALTGIDTDRLPEERRRGISIELGFAWLALPDGDRAGIVDVPGHERFIRQMLAGAQGFDLLVLVVAADDGVMPQTEEHFEICHLLDVHEAIFVITKVDLVDRARLEEVRSEIEILAAGTPFESAPVVGVSAQTGEGIDALRAMIVERLASLERPAQAGPFRMPVDRAFVLKGHGVVVTGTAAGGSIAPGDEVVVLPRGVTARVREAQVHDVAVERAYAGQRVALNLGGVDRQTVARGDTIVVAGVRADSDRFDARVEIRPSARRAVRSHERVRVYLGTRDVPARIVWLDGVVQVEPKASAYAQLVLRERAVAFAGDRFVIRDETARRTLGGGVVVLARARRHRGADGEIGPALRALEAGAPAERLLAYARTTTALDTDASEIGVELGLEGAEVARLARDSDDLVALTDPTGSTRVAARDRFDAYVADLVAATESHHAKSPNLPGIELEPLRRAVPHEIEPRLFRSIIDGLVAEGRLARSGSTVAIPGHRVSMNDEDERLSERILAAIQAGNTMPPTTKQLEEQFAVSSRRLADLLGVLVERGVVVKVAGDLAFAREVIDELQGRLRAHLEREKEITAAGFRDLIDASRKYSIPLLDYFDRSGLTLRSGDVRRLRGS
jgi:selenocysteine-specific elongation factor